jgi:CxxC motif-containing protein (DUF1111 family)
MRQLSNIRGVSKRACMVLLTVLAGGTLAAQGGPGLRPNGGPDDPGVRKGQAGAGGAYPGLGAAELTYFQEAAAVFAEVDSVSGTLQKENGAGLGPTFNGNSCAQCHAFPAVGGSSPPVNPQVALATLDGARNSVPSFIQIDGPIREARFIKDANGNPDGGVHALFTVAGRQDAPGCFVGQPDFATQVRNNNVIFRIPTPTFGLGLVEAITGQTILDNLNANSQAKAALGISGRVNRNGNDGTITKLGWKAQNKSLLIFAGEAYNVEQGVTNELFPNERDLDSSGGNRGNCDFNGVPEDHTSFPGGENGDVGAFAAFMRFLAPPTPAPPTDSTARGQSSFISIGCVFCHTPTLTTGRSSVTGMTNQDVNLYSDLALHDMGAGLADNISQGLANGREFRTAPLWGIGQRIFFLHDGRTSDLLEAIRQHASDGSEAKAVVNNFNGLSKDAQQDILNFLRSL